MSRNVLLPRAPLTHGHQLTLPLCKCHIQCELRDKYDYTDQESIHVWQYTMSVAMTACLSDVVCHARLLRCLASVLAKMSIQQSAVKHLAIPDIEVTRFPLLRSAPSSLVVTTVIRPQALLSQKRTVHCQV